MVISSLYQNAKTSGGTSILVILAEYFWKLVYVDETIVYNESFTLVKFEGPFSSDTQSLLA